MHIRTVSTYKVTTPVLHTTTQMYDFVLLSRCSEWVREVVFLSVFALAAALLAVAVYSLRAGIKHDRRMLTLRV